MTIYKQLQTTPSIGDVDKTDLDEVSSRKSEDVSQPKEWIFFGDGIILW